MYPTRSPPKLPKFPTKNIPTKIKFEEKPNE